jgi:UDPglucose 6-dehydrogenase
VAAAAGGLSGKTVAVLGLTFKPNTDDMRDSPALDIVPALIAAGATVRAYDPEGMKAAKPLLPDAVQFCKDALDAAAGADVLVVITEWNEFRALSPAKLAATMKGKVVVDLRNIFDPVAIREAGFAYTSIGRH